MTCKDIKTQAELDAALADADVSCVHIKSERGVWIELRGNQGKNVEAYDSSTVRASGSSTVRASGSSTVSAYDSSTVSAYDSSTVRAYGSSTVRAYGSSTVRASKHVAVHLHDSYATVEGGVVIDVSNLDLEDAQTWIDHHGVEVADGRVVLYKALGDDLLAPYDGTTLYVIGGDMTAPDWRDDHECGGGYHLSPSPIHARDYNSDATRYLKCVVAVEDLRPIADGSAPKAKVRALRVEVEVDEHMRELAAKS